MRKRPPLILVLTALLLATLHASAQTDFSATVAFGNSLTHNDILGLVYGNPQDLYGRDPMEAVFAKGALAGDELATYAVAGSESRHLSTQADLYRLLRRAGTQVPATLVCLEIGGNDVLNNLNLLAAHPPLSYRPADTVINTIARNTRDFLVVLRDTHPGSQLVIWTLPDVALSPGVIDDALTSEQTANLRAHVERLNELILGLERFPFVVVLDVYALTRDIVNNPPVLQGHALVPPPARGGYDHLFADEIHPTAVVNAIIANAMIESMNAKWNTAIPLYSEEELAELARINP